MLRLRNAPILRIIPIVVVVCLAGLSIQTDASGGQGATPAARTSRHIFLLDQSTLVQTGGFAGVHWTYRIQGEFLLSIDPNTQIASFVRVDANATDDSPYRRTLDPNRVFAMTSLAGTVVDAATLSFTGKAADGSAVRITATLQDNLVHLVAQTTPPPNSADFFVFSVDAVAQRKYAGGTGEQGNPYQIATAADLIALGNEPNDYDKHFILTADLDLDPNLPGRKIFDQAVIAPDHGKSNLSYFDGHAFAGRLDGQGHTIAGLVIDSDSEYAGLFGLIGDSGIVCHVRLAGGSVRGAVQEFVLPRCGTGSLAGENRGLIEDCHSNVAVMGLNVVGGLVGENRGTILTSTSAGSVTGRDRCIGGLVGHNNHGAISASRSTGPVVGENDVGGLVGYNGGWAGFNRATISLCASTGSVTGTDMVGGLAGYNEDTISTSYSTGSVSGTSSVGGLAGCNSGMISMCISTGSVTGADYDVGGLVGHNNYGTISLSASAGLVTGTDLYIGGLVGYDFCGTISDCFWDMTASGQTDSTGALFPTRCLQDTIASSLTTSNAGTGLTTAQMQDVQTFLNMGWDFLGERANGTCEFWQMPSKGGYPELSIFNGYTPPLLQGEGTPDRPYIIKTAEDLGTVWYRPTARYRLTEDVDLSGIKWVTAVIPTFCGRFDGQGHRIQGMTISGISYLGLLGLLTGDSMVWDLALEDTEVTGTDRYIGGMVGYNYSGTISNSHCRGSVSGDFDVGGLVGENHGAILAGSSTTLVKGNTCVGGLVGYSVYGTISNSYCTGSVSGNACIGGLVGYSQYATISNSYCTGSINGGTRVGGLVGWNDGDVAGCSSTGRVDGNEEIGGLVGWNSGTATDCYSRAVVSGSGENIGGLAGWNDTFGRYGDFGRISNCYSTGSVSGTSSVGGLVGRRSSGSVTSSFWDTQASGQTTSDGGTGKTTAEMHTAKTFLDAGWDFVGETANGTEDIWWIDEGKDYPRLSWEGRN